MNTHARFAKAPASAEKRCTFPVSATVRIPIGSATLTSDMEIPQDAAGLVLFAHGSGSSRHSPRNQSVARVLRAAGSGTLLFDLLTREEETEDAALRHSLSCRASRFRDALQRDGQAVADAYCAEQNALIVRDAEQYYRTMFRREHSSWSQRDRWISRAF